MYIDDQNQPPTVSNQHATIYGGIPEADRQVIRDIVNNEDFLFILNQTLKGKELDQSTQQWEDAVNPPVTNECRVRIMALVRTALSTDNRFSNIEHDVIETVMEGLHQALAEMFYTHPEYLTTNADYTTAHYLIELITNNVWVALHQAEKGHQLEMIKVIGGYSESSTTLAPTQKRRSIIPFFR